MSGSETDSSGSIPIKPPSAAALLLSGDIQIVRKIGEGKKSSFKCNTDD
jgi:hypothetical protein